jgi:hypothetical protein
VVAVALQIIKMGLLVVQAVADIVQVEQTTQAVRLVLRVKVMLVVMVLIMVLM